MYSSSPAITQLTCLSSAAVNNNRRVLLLRQTRSHPRPSTFRPIKFPYLQVLNVTSGDGRGIEVSNLENKTTASYVEDASISHNGNLIKSHSVTEEVVGASNGHTQDQVIIQPTRAAKIHDFCFGIPFGGLVLSGGLLGFIFSRNPVALSTGVLFGGGLLALSTFSLKVWRQGKSSLPFILGQAALSLALLWKNFQTYAMTKKLFPSGFNVAISAAMLCFYSYVVISGGNPPPKNLKPAVSVESS